MMTVKLMAGMTTADIKAEGITDTFKFIKHQLFLAGLKDGIRDKVLEAAKDTFTESIKFARNLETIQNDHKRLNRIAAIKADLQDKKAKEIIWDNLTDQELDQITVVCWHNQNIARSRNNGQSNNSNQTRSTTTMVRNPNIVCRYCKKKAICRKIALPANVTKLQWWTPMARFTRTTASTTSRTSLPPLLPLIIMPRPPTRMPTSGPSPTSALTTI
jgi:hypothetical protein